METAPLVLAQPVKQNLPRPAEPNLQPVHWKVLTPFTLGVCPKGQKCSTWFYMGLSEEDYNALASNEDEMLRWKEQVEWLLDYYEGKHSTPAPPK